MDWDTKFNGKGYSYFGVVRHDFPIGWIDIPFSLVCKISWAYGLNAFMATIFGALYLPMIIVWHCQRCDEGQGLSCLR